MYFNPNVKYDCFTYRNKQYYSGTKLIFSGKCLLDQREIALNHHEVTWLYNKGGVVYFKDNCHTYTCNQWDFDPRIYEITFDPKSVITENKEFYWTDDMVTKTLLYVAIMLVAILFKDRIGIWIIATIVWYFSTFKNIK